MTVSAQGRRSGADVAGTSATATDQRPSTARASGSTSSTDGVERGAVGAQAVAIALADALDVAEPRVTRPLQRVAPLTPAGRVEAEVDRGGLR